MPPEAPVMRAVMIRLSFMWLSPPPREGTHGKKLFKCRRSSIHIRKGKCRGNIGNLFSRHFHIGIHKVIQGLPILLWTQHQVTAHAELHPVVIVCAKKIIAFLLMFPRFGYVDRNPSMGGFKEFGPAGVPGNLGGMFVRWERKTNLEARGDSLRTRHRHE